MGVAIYIAKRFAVSLVILFIASFVVYAGVRVTVNPTASINSKDPSAKIRLRKQLHLDEPIVTQYKRWLGNALHGNLGVGDRDHEQVTTKLSRGLNRSLDLFFWGIVLALCVGITAGVVAAIRRNHPLDYGISGFSYLGVALPTFWFAYVLIEIFSIEIPSTLENISNSSGGKIALEVVLSLIVCAIAYSIWFFVRRSGKTNFVNGYSEKTMGIVTGILAVSAVVLVLGIVLWLPNHIGSGDPWFYIDGNVAGHFGRSASHAWTWDSVVTYFRHLAMPVMVLAIQFIASWSRYQRSSMVESLQSDYIRTAHAKGMSKRRVYFRHALRNAQLPMVTVIALDFGTLFQGLIITEFVFGISGMSSVFVRALSLGDATTIVGWVMVTACFVILANLVADLILPIIDPRIRTQ